MNFCLRALFGPCLFFGMAQLSAQPAPDGLSFLCDARAGYFSEEHFVGNGENVSGFLRFTELREDEDWVPTANIVLKGNREWQRARLRVTVNQRSPNTLQAAVTRPGGPPRGLVFAQVPESDSPVAFQLSLTRSGQLTVMFADSSVTLRVRRFRVDEVGFSCSTSKTEFTDIVSSTQ
jgi:hypothetical protein